MKTSSLAALMGVGIAAVMAAIAMLVFPISPSSSSIRADDAVESSQLTLVPLLKQKPSEIAIQVVKAADDEIVNLRLNDTETVRAIAYTTAKGDIILPSEGMTKDEGYSRIEYWFWSPIAKPLYDSDTVGNGSKIWKTSAMNYTKAFLEKIGYKLDGSEHYFAEPGGISTITVYQTISGCESSLDFYGSPHADTCIISNQPTRFHFKNDGAWIELRKWYEDIQQAKIRVAEEEAKKIAKNYMENEIAQHPDKFEQFGNLTYNDAWQQHLVPKESYKDNLVYAVTVNYLTDKEYHCAPIMGFDVFVSVYDGKVLGWRQSVCA